MKHSGKRLLIIAGIVTAIIAGVGGSAVIAFPQFFAIDLSTRQARTLRPVDESAAIWLYTNSHGVENVVPVPGANTVYASDLSGFVTRFDGSDRAHLALTATQKVGDYALGLALDSERRLFVAASEGGESGWAEGRTSIYILDTNLDSSLAELGSIAVALPCLNGIALDARGGLWLASSNFNFAFPEGGVFFLGAEMIRDVLDGKDDGNSDVNAEMVAVMTGGLLNGLVSAPDGSVLAADTLCSIFRLSGADADRAIAGSRAIAGEQAVETRPNSPLEVYRKASFVEAFDDLCVDSRGRIWSANPLTEGCIAVYDPGTRERRRVELPGFGFASSCRIRVEGSREILYVSELRAPGSSGFDGRGVLCFPIDALGE